MEKRAEKRMEKSKRKNEFKKRSEKKTKSRRSGNFFPTEAYEATGQQPADKGQPKQADETAGLGEENFLS